MDSERAAPAELVVTDDAGAARHDSTTAAGRSAWWLAESAVAVFGLGVASVGLVGLVLAMVGRWNAPLVLVVAAAPTLALGASMLRHRSELGAERASWVPLLIAVALTLVVTGWWAAYPSQHLLVNRDPGSYTNTAVYVATTGDLRVDQRGTPFDDVAALPEGATYVTGPGTYEFQFNHLLSAVMAPVYSLVSAGAMFRVPALLSGVGLFAAYLVAVRASRRPWISLVVPAALGASLPMLYVARDSFSESITFLLLWAGVLVASMSVQQRRPWIAAAAGWLLGAAVAARIDALVYALALVPLLIIWASRRGTSRQERVLTALAMVGAAAVPVAIGQIDLQWFTGNYADDLGAETWMLRIGVLASAVFGGVAALLRSRAASVGSDLRARIAAVAAAGLSLFLVYLWFVRPVTTQLRFSERPALTGYQAAEGVPVDPTRSYHEGAFVWMEWYLGPIIVALAIAGLALVVYRAVTGAASVPELAVAAIGVVAGLLYWWRPSIYADQPWGSRRFAPAVYPAAVMAGVLAVRDASTALARSAVPYRQVVIGCLSVSMLVPVVVTTWPVREGRSQNGYLAPVLSTCATVDGGAVVTIEANDPRRLAPAVRSWCDVPTVSLAAPSPAAIDELSTEWADAGRQLWLVSEDRELLEPYVVGSAPVASAVGEGSSAIERTLTRAPQRYRPPEPTQVWMLKVPPA